MNRIKELRIERGWTQTHLAEKILTSVSTISKYENSELDLGSEIIDKLATLFNVSADYLLGRTTIKASITQEEFTKTLLDSEFAKKVKPLTEEQKKTLESLIEVWTKENNVEK